jgi:hypothetical protein
MRSSLGPQVTPLRIVLFTIALLGLLGVSAPLVAQITPEPIATASVASLPDAPDPALPPTASGTDQQSQTDQPQSSQSRQTLPKPDGESSQAPSSQAPAPPSLSDLGLSPSQTKPDPDLQARLDRHTRMLRIHQRLGLITLAPLAGACITSAFAPPDLKKGNDNATGRDIHVGLGAASVTMYAFTASYAIRAPKVSEAPSRGGIKLHKYLIYIHGPGMILTPLLGAMAYDQANNGEKVHGIASAHAAVAWTTVAAYGTAIVAVTWPIHVGSLKF